MRTLLPIILLLLILSCTKSESECEIHRGSIVGYLKCHDSADNTNVLLGLFIITNNQDSLLAFNVSSDIHELDTANLEYGISQIGGNKISFCSRLATVSEIKNYECPPEFFSEQGSFDFLRFSQAILTEVSLIE